MKAAAIEFLTKPFSHEDLSGAIDQAIDLGRQIEPSKIQSNREPPCPEDELRNEITFSGIVGKGAALRRLMKQIDMVAPIDSTVLILGETGTGKELIVQAIHERSRGGETNTWFGLVALQSQRNCLKADSLAMPGERSPARSKIGLGASRSPRAQPCPWTRSAHPPATTEQTLARSAGEILRTGRRGEDPVRRCANRGGH